MKDKSLIPEHVEPPEPWPRPRRKVYYIDVGKEMSRGEAKEVMNRMRLALAAAIVALSVLVYALVPGSTVAPVLMGQGGSSVDLEGETTVISFVTPGCPACKSMYEDINELSRRGIRVIAAGVGYEKKSDMEFFSLVQKIVLDEASEERYGLWAYPTIVFVGRDGTLMYRTTGITSGFGMWWRLTLTDALGV